MQRFMSTKKMAEYLGYHPDYLRKNIGILFFEGEHFFKPPGTKSYRWDVQKMTEWITCKNISTTAQEILNKILA
ncbi:hypothetical protein NrS5_02 [Nitratiruptor phage NrS-5]|uniref:hypothetical protein n=1 Tax=unclassified Nitratiruptor TaxID=2624044 RepID=UPI001914F072|nr:MULTISPECIES: hypothetical protein [unclassified Nitratiruptor]BCD61706.1 hypothetical protein NitYY0813_C0566 [Nitratiruptor sp. YY08-13]BCD65641.1 hypothetical protein NitYY0826_C0568 [Nitratiruptor sp. YY08-26]BCD83184.1 hypothetical protein NrS4_02 [Nitratiruptor phage NrS-4]BCD83243.1 hypothetical protein NrS5_02 [Nitratiruptor phage NrS-5]